MKRLLLSTMILQGFLFLSVIHLAHGENCLGKLFSKTKSVPQELQIYLAGLAQTAIYEKTKSNDRLRLCSGTAVNEEMIITTRSCVNGRPIEKLFVTLQYDDPGGSGRKYLYNVAVTAILKEHPRLSSKTSKDVVILMVNPFPTITSMTQMREIKENVEFKNKINVYIWATSDKYARAALKVYEINGKLTTYDEYKIRKPGLKSRKSYLYARINIPLMPEWKLQQSRGSAVVDRKGKVIGLISDYIAEDTSSGQTVCLIIAEAIFNYNR